MVSAVVSRRVQGGEVEDYALATLRTPSGILFHNEVGYTMPTWPANQTDGEQKVAGDHAAVMSGATNRFWRTPPVSSTVVVFALP